MPPRHYICWNGDIRRIVLFRNIFESISTYIQNLTKDNRDPSHLAGVSLRGRWGGGEEEGLICFCAASTLLLLVLVGKMICVGGGVAAACRRCYESYEALLAWSVVVAHTVIAFGIFLVLVLCVASCG